MHIYTYSYSYIVAAWGTFSQRTDNVTVPNINQNQQCKAKKQSKDTLNEIKQILNEIKHIQTRCQSYGNSNLIPHVFRLYSLQAGSPTDPNKEMLNSSR